MLMGIQMSGDLQFANIPLLSTFLKAYSRTYLGPQEVAGQGSDAQINGDSHAEKGVGTLPEGVEELVPVETQTKIRQMFATYFQQASTTLVKGQTVSTTHQLPITDSAETAGTRQTNHEAYIKSGEIFEDRQQAYERMTKAVERLTMGVQTLADLLGLSPPVLPTATSLSQSGLQIVETQSTFTVRDDGLLAGGIWDDEEEKRFYEDLLDLKAMVPAGLLGIKEAEAEVKAEESVTDEHTEQKFDEEDIKRQLEELDLGKAELNGGVEMARDGSSASIASAGLKSSVMPHEDEEKPSDTTISEEDGLQAGPAARLTALLAALPEAVNREMIDKLVAEFAFLNSKAARKRLIRVSR